MTPYYGKIAFENLIESLNSKVWLLIKEVPYNNISF